MMDLKKDQAYKIFPKVPSFNVIANVFSYFGYSQYVRELLNLLSSRTRSYAIRHREQLLAFVVTWSPGLTETNDKFYRKP